MCLLIIFSQKASIVEISLIEMSSSCSNKNGVAFSSSIALKSLVFISPAAAFVNVNTSRRETGIFLLQIRSIKYSITTKVFPLPAEAETMSFFLSFSSIFLCSSVGLFFIF